MSKKKENMPNHLLEGIEPFAIFCFILPTILIRFSSLPSTHSSHFRQVLKYIERKYSSLLSDISFQSEHSFLFFLSFSPFLSEGKRERKRKRENAIGFSSPSLSLSRAHDPGEQENE